METNYSRLSLLTPAIYTDQDRTVLGVGFTRSDFQFRGPWNVHLLLLIKLFCFSFAAHSVAQFHRGVSHLVSSCFGACKLLLKHVLYKCEENRHDPVYSNSCFHTGFVLVPITYLVRHRVFAPVCCDTSKASMLHFLFLLELNPRVSRVLCVPSCIRLLFLSQNFDSLGVCSPNCRPQIFGGVHCHLF